MPSYSPYFGVIAAWGLEPTLLPSGKQVCRIIKGLHSALTRNTWYTSSTYHISTSREWDTPICFFLLFLWTKSCNWSAGLCDQTSYRQPTLWLHDCPSYWVRPVLRQGITPTLNGLCCALLMTNKLAYITNLDT